MSIQQLRDTMRTHAETIEDTGVVGRGAAVRRRAARIRLRRALVAAAVAIGLPAAGLVALDADPFDRSAPVVTPPEPADDLFVEAFAGRTLIDSEVATGRSDIVFTADVSRNTEWRAVCEGVGSRYTLHMAMDGGTPGKLPCDVKLLTGRWIGYQLGPEYPLEGEHTLRLWLTKASGGEKVAPPEGGRIGAAVYRLPEPAATVAGHQVQALEAAGGSEFRMVRHEESEAGTRELSSTYPAGDIPVEVDWYTSGSGSPNVQVYVDGRPETSLPLGEGGPGLVLAPEESHTVELQIVGEVPSDALLGLVWREQR